MILRQSLPLTGTCLFNGEMERFLKEGDIAHRRVKSSSSGLKKLTLFLVYKTQKYTVEKQIHSITGIKIYGAGD